MEIPSASAGPLIVGELVNTFLTKLTQYSEEVILRHTTTAL